jgi:hypothetical protein
MSEALKLVKLLVEVVGPLLNGQTLPLVLFAGLLGWAMYLLASR